MTEAPKKNIVLVSGSRKWTDFAALGETLTEQNPSSSCTSAATRCVVCSAGRCSTFNPHYCPELTP